MRALLCNHYSKRLGANTIYCKEKQQNEKGYVMTKRAYEEDPTVSNMRDYTTAGDKKLG